MTTKASPQEAPLVKIGDKFAILSHHSRHVTGPFYVTSVRGARCSLGVSPDPEPKAKRDWRISRQWSMFKDEPKPVELHQIADRFTSSRAEPWSASHEAAVRLEARKRSLRDRFERLTSTQFDGYSIDQLDAMLATIVVVPVTLLKAIDHIEQASSDEILALHRLGFVESSGEGAGKTWKVSARGRAARARSKVKS